MNYDFSEKEQAFIAAVENTLPVFTAKTGAPDADPDAAGKVLRQALAELAACGYTGEGVGSGEYGAQVLTEYSDGLQHGYPFNQAHVMGP